MKFVDRITEFVAGRTTIEQANERALIKRHERRGTEESLREITEVKPESPLLESSEKEFHSGSGSENPRFPDPYGFVRPHSHGIDETQTLPQVPRLSPPSEPSYITTSGPPDLTARDLTPEEIRQTFSTDGSWNQETQALPPQLACHGIGKFRISVSAGPEAYYQRLKRHLGDLAPEFVDLLEGTGKAETEPSAWKRFQDEYGSRSGRNNSIKSRTSRSGSVVGKQTEYIDPTTGTRVIRGFAPSASPAVTSLLREESGFFRKDSGLSLGGAPSMSTLRTDERKPRLSVNRFSNQPIASNLAPINEAGGPMHSSSRKLARPCIFSDDGDIDSAVASVEDDSGSWVDLVDHDPRRRRTSALSKMIEDAKKSKLMPKSDEIRPQPLRARTASTEAVNSRSRSRTGLDRSRSLHGIRPQFRRSHSRKLSTLANEQYQAENPTQPHPETTEVIDDSSEEAEGLQILTPASGGTLISANASRESNVWMANLPAHPKLEANSEIEQVDTMLGSSAKTMVPKKTRARSDTAIRLPQVDGEAVGADKNAST